MTAVGFRDSGDGAWNDLRTVTSWPWQGSQIRYDHYELSLGQWVLYGSTGLLLAWLTNTIFYQSFVFLFVLAPLGVIVPLVMRKNLCEKRRNILGSQFKDAILALSSALQAGYSAENAWREAWQEMVCIYGEDGLITREFAAMVRAISVNETPEQVLEEFAERSGMDEIIRFAQVFRLAKRSSGDLVSIIDSTSRTISEKLRVREEIITVTTAKQLEQTIMSVIPAAIILYLRFAFVGFLDVLYEGIFGRMVMTVCLLIYAVAILLGRRMVRLEQW
ncbi:MAG: type II secretion system F family protein [Lachnospiraceae bacterium]|nr:type II secretion system F family protein [Lachnospiraceae bacterium]